LLSHSRGLTQHGIFEKDEKIKILKKGRGRGKERREQKESGESRLPGIYLKI
jgi:hypothetical protein